MRKIQNARKLWLPQSFFLQDTLVVAKALLGKALVRKIGKRQLYGKIVETEAYCGASDLACHASRGKTPRNAVMFGPGGYWYVYLIYGMYHCLNIVTQEEGNPCAVLIRAVEPLSGFSHDARTNGPGKLCRAYEITKELNATSAFTEDSVLWIEETDHPAENIVSTTRVGIDYAGLYKEKPWRFYLAQNRFVSKK